MTTDILLTLLAIALAAPIGVRCVCVAVKVSGNKFKQCHGSHKWHGFAMSYIAQGAAAGFAVLNVFRTGGSTAVWLFLLAGAGFVLFDPRKIQ